MSQYFLNRASVDLQDVPLLFPLLFSGSADNRAERAWYARSLIYIYVYGKKEGEEIKKIKGLVLSFHFIRSPVVRRAFCTLTMSCVLNITALASIYLLARQGYYVF